MDDNGMMVAAINAATMVVNALGEYSKPPKVALEAAVFLTKVWDALAPHAEDVEGWKRRHGTVYDEPACSQEPDEVSDAVENVEDFLSKARVIGFTTASDQAVLLRSLEVILEDRKARETWRVKAP